MIRAPAVAFLLVCTPAHGQRAAENAVTAADDAFGTSVGRETIGLYSSGSVRGFSANAAGNARIDGLYFDPVWSPTARIRSSTNIRVGLSAQGFPFPAPTGVVDYALLAPGREAALSSFSSADSYGSWAQEIDGTLPLTDTLSLGGGFGFYRNAFFNKTAGLQAVRGAVLSWKPTSQIEVRPFWSRSDIWDDEFGAIYIPGSPFLPPDPPRRRFDGPDRPKYRSTAFLFGTLLRLEPAPGWLLRGSVVRTGFNDRLTAAHLLLDLQPDGSAQRVFVVDPPSRLVSTSGELRLSRSLADGPRLHTVHLSARARDRRDRYGGSAEIDLGPSRIGDFVAPLDPPFDFGSQTLDEVKQWTGGLGYEGRWKDVGEISLGLQRTDYRKRVEQPGLAIVENRATPWLLSVAGAVTLTSSIVVYAGFTNGLEESGVAPPIAINRGEALAAIRTSQRDAGLRWTIQPGLKLVAGLFDVRKPYFNLDETNRWADLGDVRHRGVEASLAGALTPNLDIVAGAVLLEARVTGEGVTLGRLGPKPVGQPARTLQLNLDWRPPQLKGLSLDAGIQHLSQRIARRDNLVSLPARTLLDVGARYRFRIGSTQASLRVEASNLFNVYGFDLQGAGAYDLIPGRVVGLSLAADL